MGKVPLIPIRKLQLGKFKIQNYENVRTCNNFEKIIVPFTIYETGITGTDKFYEIIDLGDGFYNLICRKSKEHFYAHARKYEKTSSCMIL